MGNYMIKLLFHNDHKENGEPQTVKQQRAADENMCTPNLSEKKVLCDPRSVSSEIVRTPIEVKS